MGFIPTTQTEKAKKLLQEKRSVVIKGNPGEGKTSTALHLIDNNNYTDQRVVVIRPKQWEKVDTDLVKIVILEDIFGQYDLDPGLLQDWIDRYLQKIQNHVDEGKLQVIITIRDDILSKALLRLKSFKLFHSDRTLTLCSDKLNNLDKDSILNRELKRNNKNMNVHEKEQCIVNFKGLIGFPQCCTLFAGDEDLFVQGPDFFKSPEKFLVNNIRNLKADSFLSLAFLFCNNEIEEEYLSPSQKKSKNYLPVLQDIAQSLRISFDESNLMSLRQSYEHYSGLYVKKVSCQDHSGDNLSYLPHSGGKVSKSFIKFSHATVCEAVGQVLGDKCPEMVVKHGDSEYLYQRTYTSEAKDDSQNVFIPVSVYGLLAERMVHDVVEKRIVESVVKHSALKEDQFVKKLKNELHEVNRIKDFFMADPYTEYRIFQDVSKGHCITFLQCVLQSDEDAVKLVYSHLMEFLACTHNNKGNDCWQCEEKQTLLELALYYHHFEIADQLITMNACYTHVSLCNTTRHGELSRVQTILEDLKRRQVLNPDCTEAEQTLYRAYISGNQNVIEILLQEGFTLHNGHVIDVVLDGDINVLMKVVEHLKINKNWDLHLEEDMRGRYFLPPDMYSLLQSDFVNEMHCSTEALYITYCKEKFDMADYLMKNETNVTLDMLRYVSKYSSQQAVARVIQNLKDTGTWDPHCNVAYKALETAYSKNKHDVCDLLIQEGVTLKMKNLSGVINAHEVSLESVEKLIQHLKDTHSWDSKCNDASKALQTAYMAVKADVCNLLIHEGVSLTMKDLAGITFGSTYRKSLVTIKKSIQHLKDNGRWDPMCEEASNAFIKAIETEWYEVCSLLIEEGVSCAIQHLHVVTLSSLDLVKKTVEQLKDTDSWDAKCHDASKALEMAYSRNKHDVCQWLIQEGVSLTMRNLAHVISTDQILLESIKKIIKHLKDTDCWDPKNVHASEALEKAYVVDRYDVCDLLIQEGISLTMNTFLNVSKMRIFSPIETVKKIIQHLKDIDSWDPRCDDASEALEVAFGRKYFDVFDLLFQEGVSLKMKFLPYMIKSSKDVVKTAVKNLKDTNSWDAKCDDACEALAKAYVKDQYDVCQLMIQEGVSLTMKNLPGVIITYRDDLNYFRTVRVSLESVKKAIQHLKDTDSWDAKCDDASKALVKAYMEQLYDVCQLLIHEGVSLTMKNLPGVISTIGDDLNLKCNFRRSFKSVQKTIQHMKNTGSWDPKCDDASKALEKAYMEDKYGISDLLMQEGVPLTMKCLCYMPLKSIEDVKTTVQQLKGTDIWDEKCNEASEALEKAFRQKKNDMCDLLIQEGVTLTMKNLPGVMLSESMEFVQKAVQYLKHTDSWDAKCNEASEALEKAFREEKNDVCDLLIQEGVTLTMKNLSGVIPFSQSLKTFQKAVQYLKDNDSWDPKCDDASKALEEAYGRGQYDVCHLLTQEGVSLTMSNLASIVSTYSLALENAEKVIQHLKDSDSWDPKCDDAFKALEVAYAKMMYDVQDLLIQEGVLHH